MNALYPAPAARIAPAMLIGAHTGQDTRKRQPNHAAAILATLQPPIVVQRGITAPALMELPAARFARQAEPASQEIIPQKANAMPRRPMAAIIQETGNLCKLAIIQVNNF
jgi:hypothetical protein